MGINVFYPSLKCRLFLRFEDFAPPTSPSPLPLPLPKTGPELFKENQGFVSTADIVPYSASYTLNSYRQADECHLTLPMKALPFDPRIIRAAAIQVFGGVVTPDEYATAMGPNGQTAVVPDLDFQGRPTEVFRGVIDKWEATLEGHDTVRLEARDATGVLIDAEITENVLAAIPGDLPLDQAIELLLLGDGKPPGTSKVPGLPGIRGLGVVNETGEPVLPTIRQIKPPQVFDSAGKIKRGKPGRGAKKKSSYWDLITDLAVGAGFLAYIRLGTIVVPSPVGTLTPVSRPVQLVITNPRTYYGETNDVRTFFYGGNVDKLRIRRNLTGLRTPTVEVRAYGSRVGRTFRARFPPTPTDNMPAPSGQGDREEVQVFTLKLDPTTPQGTIRLTLAAESIYEQLGRGEFEVNIKTKAMSILGFSDTSKVNTLDPDMFFLRPSDSIFVATNIADEGAGQVSTAVVFSTAGVGEKAAAIVADVFGGDQTKAQIATEVAQALESEFLQKVFRVQTIVVQWDYDRGFDFEVNSINFLDVRNATLATSNIQSAIQAAQDFAQTAVEALKERL